MKNTSYQMLAVVLCLFGFIACGDAENTTQTEKQKVSQRKNTNIKVTGALNSTLSGGALISCKGDKVSLRLMKDMKVFGMDFPRDITIGEHKYEEEKHKSPVNSIDIGYRERDVSYFLGKGTFNISAIPTKKGERFAATIKAQMQNKDDAINLEADIDMVVRPKCFDKFNK